MTDTGTENVERLIEKILDTVLVGRPIAEMLHALAIERDGLRRSEKDTEIGLGRREAAMDKLRAERDALITERDALKAEKKAFRDANIYTYKGG